MWILIVRSPLKNPREYFIKEGLYVLGRNPDSEVVIEDESASRHHAEIECQNGELIIRDLGSTNGTFVNRERISEPRKLKDGDQIRVGFHVANIVDQKPADTDPENDGTDQSDTQKLSRELLIESIDKNAILLHDFTTRLTTVLDLDQSLREIADFLRTTIGADKCQVVLADQFKQIDKLGFSSVIANQTISKRSVIIIPDSYHIGSISDSAVHHRIRTALCIPVIDDQEIIALVYAYKTDSKARPFDQNDVQLSIAISHQAALAIQRSRILEQARGFEQLALTDSLTGLHNRRNFLKMAENEIERARRFDHSLSMMIIDIDDFKNINDAYGHLVGDQVLKAVANRLQNNLRNIDLLARYGGDEFVIILVESDNNYADGIGKRLLESITNKSINTDRGQVQITISIGIATLDGELSNEVDLLRIADDALYAAKSAGKNQIVVVE